jgi:hypothetical protein
MSYAKLPFEKIENEALKPLLEAALNLKVKASLWTSAQKATLSARITQWSGTGGLCLIGVQNDLEGIRFEKFIVDHVVEEIFISLSLPTDVIFMKAQYKRSDPGNLYFRLTEAFKVQRRRAIRLPIPLDEQEYKWVSFKIEPQAEDTVVTYLQNISYGGVAVAFGDEKIFKTLKPEQKIYELNFQIEGVSLQTSAIIKHLQMIPKVSPKIKFRLGIQFDGLGRKEEEIIRNYVFEESSKFFGRL